MGAIRDEGGATKKRGRKEGKRERMKERRQRG